MSIVDLSEVRRRAWETRRQKYGAKGHGRGCYRTAAAPKATVDAALEQLDVARKACVRMLPDPLAHKAITAIDRAYEALAPGMYVNATTLGIDTPDE